MYPVHQNLLQKVNFESHSKNTVSQIPKCAENLSLKYSAVAVEPATSSDTITRSTLGFPLISTFSPCHLR